MIDPLHLASTEPPRIVGKLRYLACESSTDNTGSGPHAASGEEVDDLVRDAASNQELANGDS